MFSRDHNYIDKYFRKIGKIFEDSYEKFLFS